MGQVNRSSPLKYWSLVLCSTYTYSFSLLLQSNWIKERSDPVEKRLLQIYFFSLSSLSYPPTTANATQQVHWPSYVLDLMWPKVQGALNGICSSSESKKSSLRTWRGDAKVHYWPNVQVRQSVTCDMLDCFTIPRKYRNHPPKFVRRHILTINAEHRYIGLTWPEKLPTEWFSVTALSFCQVCGHEIQY